MKLLLDPRDDTLVRSQLVGLEPFPSFGEAAKSVLAYLQDSFGFALWMVTRTSGEDCVVLESRDAGYGIRSGDVFRWADGLCSRMVRGEGPRIAPDVNQIAAYRTAPVLATLPIGAYVSVPLCAEDGSLFGTLCGIDPLPKPDELTTSLPLIELQARLLSSLLAVELEASQQTRRADLLEQTTRIDALTGLMNRRGWDTFMAAEELRCQRHGSPASVIVVDLDGLKSVNDTSGHAAGDALLIRAGHVLKQATRNYDVLARLGGDEFGLLAPETAAPVAEVLATRLQSALLRAGISASVGVAGRPHTSAGLTAAWAAADAAMYSEKRARQIPTPHPV